MIKPEEYPLWNSPVVRAFLKTLTPENMMAEGRGRRIRDVGGRWFLDARSGLWNVSLGYDNPQVIAAMKRQLDTLPYANMIGYGRPSAISAQAASALIAHLPPQLNKVRYCSNGSQAAEIAVLLSRFLHRSAGASERDTVFTLWHGFHGLGVGAGALTGQAHLHEAYGPLMPGVRHARGPFESTGDEELSDLERQIMDFGPDRVAAVLIEPIVGEGGHILSDDYLRSLERFCRARGIHLIVDEVTTGMGRTGAFTRSEQVGIQPDILLLGKGLTSGYAPLSAVVLADAIYEQVLNLPFDRPMFIGATYDGHPLALAASIAVIDVLTGEGVLDNVQRRGAQLHHDLAAVVEKHPGVSAARGTGLMRAVEVATGPDAPHAALSANTLRLAMEERGVLVSTLASWPAITIMPPLVITESEVDEIVTALDQALSDLHC